MHLVGCFIRTYLTLFASLSGYDAICTIIENFSKILDFSNNLPVLIMSDNFAFKNPSLKVATLKM
jgi:hypothetical protein